MDDLERIGVILVCAVVFGLTMVVHRLTAILNGLNLLNSRLEWMAEKMRHLP